MTNEQSKRLEQAINIFFMKKGINTNITVNKGINWIRNVLDLLNKYGLIHIWESYYYRALDNLMFHPNPKMWAKENISILILMFLIESEHWFDESTQKFSVAIDGTEVIDSYMKKSYILDILIEYTLKGYSIFYMDVIPFVKGDK